MNESVDLPNDLIENYLQKAAHVVRTPEERQILDTARALNRVAEMSAPPGKEPITLYCYNQLQNSTRGIERRSGRGGQAPVSVLSSLILKEILEALCKNGARYKAERKELRDNANVLIGAIALYVAGIAGAHVAVVTALVATMLRVVLKIGISVFCKMAN